MKFMVRLLALGTSMLVASVMAQTKWDLAAAYAPSNFHTQNLALFAADVEGLLRGNGLPRFLLRGGNAGAAGNHEISYRVGNEELLSRGDQPVVRLPLHPGPGPRQSGMTTPAGSANDRQDP